MNKYRVRLLPVFAEIPICMSEQIFWRVIRAAPIATNFPKCARDFICLFRNSFASLPVTSEVESINQSTTACILPVRATSALTFLPSALISSRLFLLPRGVFSGGKLRAEICRHEVYTCVPEIATDSKILKTICFYVVHKNVLWTGIFWDLFCCAPAYIPTRCVKKNISRRISLEGNF